MVYTTGALGQNRSFGPANQTLDGSAVYVFFPENGPKLTCCLAGSFFFSKATEPVSFALPLSTRKSWSTFAMSATTAVTLAGASSAATQASRTHITVENACNWKKTERVVAKL